MQSVLCRGMYLSPKDYRFAKTDEARFEIADRLVSVQSTAPSSKKNYHISGENVQEIVDGTIIFKFISMDRRLQIEVATVSSMPVDDIMDDLIDLDTMLQKL